MISQLHYTSTVLPPLDSLNDALLPPSASPPMGSEFEKHSEFNPSYDHSSQPDTTLLTPASATQSPQTQNSIKFPTPYPTPPSCSTSLLQDPVNQSGNRMYGAWNPAFDLNAPSSQANSPMTTQHPLAPEFLESYAHGHDGRRTPGPPEQSYMGHFGVTDSQPLGQGASQSFYMSLPPANQQGPHATLMRGNVQGITDSRGVSRSVPSSSLLNHAPHGLREDHRDNASDATYQSRSINGSPRSLTGAQTGRVRKNRRAKRQGSATSKGTSHDSETLGEYMNCRGQEVPPTLKDTCPEEERCIFDSRWRHRKDKGHTMWDGIQEDYRQHFGRAAPGKETLQMKFKRARSKYIEWLPEDVDIMRQAWKEMEDERYETLLQKFLKKGGSRNMLLNATDVEFKVVSDMKLEEGMYMHAFKESMDMDIRRRQKANPPKKRSSARSTGQSQHNVTGLKMESDEDTFMTSHGEDEIIDQVQNARRDQDRLGESGSQQFVGRWGPGVSMLGGPMWDDRHSVNTTMPPLADPLMGHPSSSSLQRREI
ncbi:hypothetical protein LIA77_05919 [Sarocladium implicatum]|nr:hypothetical protein LIA77_05919 [Sarocladium implicatum]